MRLIKISRITLSTDVAVNPRNDLKFILQSSTENMLAMTHNQK